MHFIGMWGHLMPINVVIIQLNTFRTSSTSTSTIKNYHQNLIIRGILRIADIVESINFNYGPCLVKEQKSKK